MAVTLQTRRKGYIADGGTPVSPEQTIANMSTTSAHHWCGDREPRCTDDRFLHVTWQARMWQ
jgi:hypothetical protein